MVFGLALSATITRAPRPWAPGKNTLVGRSALIREGLSVHINKSHGAPCRVIGAGPHSEDREGRSTGAASAGPTAAAFASSSAVSCITDAA